MQKRTIEVFVAGCPCCDEAVALVKSLTCDMRVPEILTPPFPEILAP